MIVTSNWEFRLALPPPKKNWVHGQILPDRAVPLHYVPWSASLGGGYTRAHLRAFRFQPNPVGALAVCKRVVAPEAVSVHQRDEEGGAIHFFKASIQAAVSVN